MQQVHVAVAVIYNSDQQILVSLRPDHVHQGGRWEFPGGKVEAGEDVDAALRRELNEELGITVTSLKPFKVIHHTYSDKRVLLEIFTVTEFEGLAHGKEGQPIKWLSPDALDPAEFPEANKSIIRTLQFPEAFMITGGYQDADDFLVRLRDSLERGIRLVQLRAKQATADELKQLCSAARTVCKQYNAKLLINIEADAFDESLADGLHLTSQQLHSLDRRPFGHSCLLSASCHTPEDLQQAKNLEADLLLLSPVKETKSHPGVPGIGWQRFAEMIEDIDIPVYALGGMSSDDIRDARACGGQGVAAISSFWNNP